MCALLFLATPVAAAPELLGTNSKADRIDLLAKAQVTMQEAIVRAVSDRPGMVAEAEITSMNGLPVFEIEVIGDDGRPYEVYVNGENGNTMKIESEGLAGR